MILAAESGAYAVVIPIVFEGKVQDCYPSPILAWRLCDTTGAVLGIITPSRIFPPGSPVWGPEGMVETDTGEWPSLQHYCKHLQHTLIQ